MTKLNQIRGLHHVTSLAGSASQNNAFFTRTLGLRRVKKTVNFDAPDVYHLYYGDEVGRPGGVMTYFPFPDIARGRPGSGEVGETVFAVPEGALPFWIERLHRLDVDGLKTDEAFGEREAAFRRPRRRRLRAGRGQGRRAAGLDAGRRRRRARDPRLPLGVAAAARRWRHGGTPEVHGLQRDRRMPTACAASRRRAATAPISSTSRRCPISRRRGRARARCITSPSRSPTARRSLEVRKALMDTGYAGDAGDRPRLFLGDLFPHARRRAVRGRHRRARLRSRRRRRASRAGAETAGASTRICASGWKSSSNRSRIDGDDDSTHTSMQRGAGRSTPWCSPSTAPAATSASFGRSRAPSGRGPPWSRRAATFPNTARCASSAARRKGSTTTTISRAAPRRWRGSCARTRRASGARRVIGVGYSNGANILAAVAFAEPGLFDDLALMHPLVPWRPADDARLAAARVLITAGRRDPICPPALTQALADFWSRQGPRPAGVARRRTRNAR